MRTLLQNEIIAVTGATLPESGQNQPIKFNFTYVANEICEGATIGTIIGFFFANTWKGMLQCTATGAVLGGSVAALRFAANELDKNFNLF